PDEAIRWFRKALEADPSFLTAAVNIQNVLENTGRYAEAVDEIRALVDLMPDNDGLRVQLAKLYRVLGHLDQAMESIVEVLRRSPNNIEALKLYGILLQSAGKNDKARDVYKKIVRLDPRQASFKVELARLHREAGNIDAAITELEEYLVSRPKDYGARVELARAYGLKGDWAHSAQILKEVLADKPDDAEAMLELSVAYQAMGDKQSAVDLAGRLVNLRGGRGRTEDLDGLEDSIKAYEHAVKVYSGDMHDAWERNIAVLRDSLRSEAAREDSGTDEGLDAETEALLGLMTPGTIAVDEEEEILFLDDREEPLDAEELPDEALLAEDEDETPRIDELLRGEELYADGPALGGSGASPRSSGQSEPDYPEARQEARQEAPASSPRPENQVGQQYPDGSGFSQQPQQPQAPQQQMPLQQPQQAPQAMPQQMPYLQGQQAPMQPMVMPPSTYPPYPPYPPYPQRKPKRDRLPSLEPMDLSQPEFEAEESAVDEEAPEYIEESDAILQDETAAEESIPAEEPIPEYIEEPDLGGESGEQPEGGEETPLDEDAELLEDLAGLPEEGLELVSEEEDEDVWSEPAGEDEETVMLEESPEEETAREPKMAEQTPEAATEPAEAASPEATPPAAAKPDHWVDPLGPEAAKLFMYLKDLSKSLPREKRKDLVESGIEQKLDRIIEYVTKPRAEDDLPTEIYGVAVSSRLTKLLQFMRREKHDALK
ncbi:MAG: tetratricopeptide repeat protein, partial [Spirochaetales bacterium]